MTTAILIYAIAVALPLFAAARVGSWFLRRHGRQERGVWLVALAAMLVLPMVMLVPSTDALRSEWSSVIELGAIEIVPLTAPLPTAAPSVQSVTTDQIVVGLWVLVSLVLALRWLVSALRLARLRRSWVPVMVDCVEVLVSPDFGPATFGVLRPRIVIPAPVMELPTTKRALVIQHELEHRRAGDHLVMFFARVARILAAWNPCVWSASRSLRASIESDCDRRVIRRRRDVAAYAETLLTVSAMASGRLAAATHFAEHQGQLHRRIVAMTTPRRALSLAGLFGTLSVGVLLAVGAVSIPVPAVEPRLGEASTDQSALPAPRVISDPARGLVLVFRRVSEDPRRPPVSENVLVGGDGAWFRVEPPPPGEILGYTLPTWGVVVPFTPQSPISPEQIGDLTAPPTILNADEILRVAQQAYPIQLRDRGLGGTVGVQILVSATGLPERVRVGQISAYPELNEAALAVARVYRFSPARVGAEPVAVWVSHPIDFRAP